MKIGTHVIPIALSRNRIGQPMLKFHLFYFSRIVLDSLLRNFAHLGTFVDHILEKAIKKHISK